MKKETKKKKPSQTAKSTHPSRVTMAKQKEKEKQQKKRRIQYQKIGLVLGIGIFFTILIWSSFQIRIRTIIIRNNSLLSDQEIIDLANIRNYPSTLRTPSFRIQKNLEEDDLIVSAKVEKKKFLTEVIITVEENRPLFYYETYHKVVLSDGTLVDGDYPIPTVINEMPEDVYTELIEKMASLPTDVIRRISEIRYSPDGEPNLFRMAMNDSNYVYVDLSENFKRLGSYLTYVQGFSGKHGEFHLEQGEYLEIKEDE